MSGKKSSFKFNKALAQEEIKTGGNHLDTSGCYVVQITKAEVVIGSKNDKTSKSEALVLSVKTPKTDGSRTANFLRINYLKKDGEIQEGGYATVSQLVEIAGKEEEMENFPKCLEKSIVGMFLEVKLGEYQGNKRQEREIRGFYDKKTFLTPYEAENGEDHKTYDTFIDRYKDAEPIPYIKQGRTAEQAVQDKKNSDPAQSQHPEEDDEFPF